ncbi:DNA-binding transcriptional regulator YhcF (GntR family) [Bacillus tianshenii]|uniref:DNA-binding transcriptional regulator YhcF (GntR family) n=1 Tax=Sutcliffiella tianshenii TaxID=1463404 RepID=A0ABS2NUS8_9BACI|nr:anti-repressor SinI family protein [Bacillus tianshenii]MBM7618242.1 DNA-binding transcriptional regulator YhcF (GntR family) [Bacillus tianshenii]
MEKVAFNLTENLDKEWVELIGDALEMGISTEEIRDFLHNNTNSSYKNL